MPSPIDCQVVRGPEAMERAGRALAGRLRPGDVVMVRGEVGAGKSTLIRAILREFGVAGAIPSPTFAIGRTYETAATAAGRSTPQVISHLDLHRLGPVGEEDPGLLAMYFGPDRIALVEWPEGREEYLAGLGNRLLEVRLTHRDEQSRLLGPLVPVTGRG